MHPQEGELAPGRAPLNPTVWAVRLATVAMLMVALVVLWKRYHTDPAQEELVRYATLTVPAYLDDLARLHALLDRLDGPGLGAAPARALLVDEVMPFVIRMRKRAEGVQVESPAVREANAQYLAALDAYLETERAAVRAIDDPSSHPAEAHQAIRARRREADEGVRTFLAGLRGRCERAGIKLVPAAPPTGGAGG